MLFRYNENVSNEKSRKQEEMKSNKWLQQSSAGIGLMSSSLLTSHASVLSVV